MTVLTAVVSGLITKDTKHMQIDDHPSCHHRLVRTIRTYFLQSTRTGHLGVWTRYGFASVLQLGSRTFVFMISGILLLRYASQVG
jgi:hypothetical protein